MGYSGSQILIVDDEEGIRDLFKDNLAEQGYISHTANNGTRPSRSWPLRRVT